jgi:AcrR family transcriptional regulator
MAKRKSNVTTDLMPAKVDKRIAVGDATRKKILACAVAIAGSTGFASLTIGTLAQASGLSKSSLFTHFATRKDLVIATLDAAYDEFDREVLDVCRASPPTLMMRVFLRRYFEYLNNRPKSHACIITSSAFEFDADDDSVRERVVQLIERRRAVMRELLHAAREAGVIGGTKAELEQQLFDYESLMVGFVYRYQLEPTEQIFERLVAGVRRLFANPAVAQARMKGASRRKVRASR